MNENYKLLISLNSSIEELKSNIASLSDELGRLSTFLSSYEIVFFLQQLDMKERELERKQIIMKNLVSMTVNIK